MATTEAMTTAQKNSSASARRPSANCSGAVVMSAVATSADLRSSRRTPSQYVKATATMPEIVESVASVRYLHSPRAAQYSADVAMYDQRSGLGKIQRLESSTHIRTTSGYAHP